MEPEEGSRKLEWGIPVVCRLTGIPTQRREEARKLIYEITNSCQDIF